MLAGGPISRLSPLQYANKGIIICQHDKDDVEKLGLVKMDLLGLKILSIIDKTVMHLKKRGIEIDIDAIPRDDEGTYAMLRSTNTVGVFQLESPGMRELLGRLQPTKFEDIVAAVSLFRPGPMQGDMITPFIARRQGREKVVHWHPSLESVLADTFGVILYQEQVLEVAHILAGFTLGQADLLRRAMTKDRSPEEMSAIRRQFLDGCKNKGVDQPTANLVFEKLASFAAYGFNKAHAAEFALTAYQSAYLKTHYPAEFLCATLDSWPCGFYCPLVIAWQAQGQGIAVRPPAIGGAWDCTVEEDGAIRLGQKYLPGAVRRRIPKAAAEDPTMPLFQDYGAPDDDEEETVTDAEIAHLMAGLTDHPVAGLGADRSLSRDAAALPHGTSVTVGGVVISRQTPPTRSGKRIIFLTLHDESGLVDVTVFPDIQEKYAKTVYRSSALRITGTVRKTGAAGFSLTAQKIEKLA